MRKTVGSAILICVVSVLYALWLMISRNTIWGWIVFAVLVAAFIIARARMIKQGRLPARTSLLMWACFLILLLANLKVSEPPYRQVPAVSGENGGVTDTVSVAQGDLTGVYTADKEVEVYAGIPYAAPPVGDLRFCEPQAPASWEGVRACDKFAPMAMQSRDPEWKRSLGNILSTHDFCFKLFDNYREPVSEDCLYLNVWKPGGTQNGKLPVVVYIHGGSLMTGQSYDELFNQEEFARQGVVAVTVAYRLGVFGFFANEELEAQSEHKTTGDYGLLDQIAALNWVHDNIAAFGGDPDSITIAGESAGSMCVNAICASPLTEGLFRYAIAESGGIVAKHPYILMRDREDALQMGHDIMNEMNVSSVEELRKLSADELVKTTYINKSLMVDGYALEEMPYLTYERGENHEKALLNGFNGKEGDKFFLTKEVTTDNYLEGLKYFAGDHAEELAEIVPAGSITRDQVTFGEKGGDAKGSFDFVGSAAYFSYSHHLWSNYMVSQGRPVYEYYFTKTNDSRSDFHNGEVPYAYGNLHRLDGKYTDADYALSDKMVSYWVNFIKTGDPNGQSVQGDALPTWDARAASDEKLLELNEDISMITDPYIDLYPVFDKYMDSKED